MKLVFRPQAEADLARAKRWHEDEQIGLGERFRREVFATVDQLRNYPESAPRVRGDIRRAVIRRFPYSVFYIAREHQLVVLRVLHSARDPNAWPER